MKSHKIPYERSSDLYEAEAKTVCPHGKISIHRTMRRSVDSFDIMHIQRALFVGTNGCANCKHWLDTKWEYVQCTFPKRAKKRSK